MIIAIETGDGDGREVDTGSQVPPQQRDRPCGREILSLGLQIMIVVVKIETGDWDRREVDLGSQVPRQRT